MVEYVFYLLVLIAFLISNLKIELLTFRLGQMNNFINMNKQSTQSLLQKSTTFKQKYQNDSFIQNDKIMSPLRTTVTMFGSNRMSATQEQIYGHDVVKGILDRSTRKTLRHNIHRVDPETQLYCRPITHEITDCSDIPPKNRMYASICSEQITMINQGLNKQSTIQQKLDNLSRDNKKTSTSNKRPSSASNYNKNPRICASGVVNYNFSSVKAKNSLVLGRKSYEDKMKQQIEQLKEKQYCANSRNKRIVQNRSYRAKGSIDRNEKMILADPTISTEQYLDFILKQKQQNASIYREKAKKLDYIRDYMISEKADLDLAQHVIEEVEKTKPKVTGRPTKVAKPKPNEEHQFQTRRKPIIKKKIFVNSLFFVQ